MRETATSDESIILQMAIGLLYPFMLLFGFYIILNGMFTPGGGFQGGSVLASLFVARYVIYPVDDADSRRLHQVERIFLTLILVIPTVFLFSGFLGRHPVGRTIYLITMDLLIGMEVAFGLGVAVLRFAFFKGTGQTWRL